MVEERKYNINNKYSKKIVLISDIHYSKNYNYKIFDKIINSLKNNNPDYICITGDIIDDSRVLEDNTLKQKLFMFFEELGKLSKVIVSIGNHDFTDVLKKKHEYLFHRETFLELNSIDNIYLLDNESIVIDDFCFIGLTLDFNYYYDIPHESENSFIKNINNELIFTKDKYNILLCHSPIVVLNSKVIKEVKIITEADLILSGHMHNGLVVPLLDKIKNNKGIAGPFNKFFPKISRGIVKKKVGNKYIYLVISGGVVKFSKISPKILHPFNILFPIHIEYIDL